MVLICTEHPLFVFLRGESAINFIKKAVFPYENPIFSSSIRNAVEE